VQKLIAVKAGLREGRRGGGEDVQRNRGSQDQGLESTAGLQADRRQAAAKEVEVPTDEDDAEAASC